MHRQNDPSSGSRFVPLLLLIAIPTILFADVLFLGSNFYIRDLYRYHFPMKHVVRDVVASGEFPYWNRSFAGGQPMAANPAYEIFYPPQWLIFVGPYERGFALHILFHVYLALLGMYALLRALPLSPPAAFGGAFSFGLGGLLLGTMTNLPTFFVWSWAGLGGWAALRFVRLPTRATFAVAAVVLAMPMLVAEPVALAQMWTLIVAGAWMFDRRPIRLVGLLLAVVLLLAAVQLLPMIDHFRDSARARGFSYDVVTDYSMPIVRPLELMTPHPFSFPRAPGQPPWGARLFPREPYLVSIYCGLFAAIFAAAGILARVRGYAILLLLAAGSYALAIGGNTPLFRWLYAMGIRSIRYPEKFAMMGLVAMIMFASVVADRVLGGDFRAQRAAIAAAIGIAVILATAVVLMPEPARPTLAIGALIALGWSAALWRGLPLIAALGLIVVDLAPLANDISARVPRSFFTPPPIARALPPASTVVHRGEWFPDDPNLRRYQHAAPSWLTRNGLRPLLPAAWGLRSVLQADVDETFLSTTHDLIDAFKRSGGADRIIALTGADYVLDWRDFDSAWRETDDPSRLQPLVVRRTSFGGRYHTRARIRAIRETTNTATIDVEADVPAPLVILVTRHKYWHVTIDGRDAAVSPANIAYQSVMVPRGRHRVVMRYRNPLVGWGALISAFVLVTLIVPTPPRRRPRSGS